MGPVTYFLSRRSPWTQRLHQRVSWFLRDVSLCGERALTGGPDDGRVSIRRSPPTPPPSGPATTPTGPSRRAPLAMIIGVVVLAVLTVILLAMLLTRGDGTASSFREPDAFGERDCLGQRFSFTGRQPERDAGRHPIRRPAGSAGRGSRHGRGDDRREPDRARRSRARCRTSRLARKRGPLVRRRRADRRRRLPLVPRLGARPAAEHRLCRGARDRSVQLPDLVRLGRGGKRDRRAVARGAGHRLPGRSRSPPRTSPSGGPPSSVSPASARIRSRSGAGGRRSPRTPGSGVPAHSRKSQAAGSCARTSTTT